MTLDKITGLEVAKMEFGCVTPEHWKDERPVLVFAKSGKFVVGGTELENTIRMTNWCLTVNNAVIADWLLSALRIEGGRYGEWDVLADVVESAKNNEQIIIMVSKNDLHESD